MFLLSRRIKGGEGRGGRPLLLPTASLPAADTRTLSSRTLDVFAARSLAVGRVRIFRDGIPGPRGRAAQGRER